MMGAGIAGSLLVFTGLWHALEWLMGGRNKDTLRLIPVGLVYVLLGYLLVMSIGGIWTVIVAFVLTAIGMSAALMMRNTAEIRKWVTWAFILIDGIILLGLASVFLS